MPIEEFRIASANVGNASEAGGFAMGDALANATNQFAAGNASIAELQAQLGSAHVETAMQAKVAARLLHPRRAPWKLFMAAAMERAMPI